MKVYFDNASTSQKKPEEVFNNIKSFYYNNNTNPGRGGYKLSIKSSEMIYNTRKLLKKFFNTNKDDSVIFTRNVTEALNIVINGVVKKNDHLLISSIEHNSVYRKVENLKEKGFISYDIIPIKKNGEFDIKNIEKYIKDKTKAIIINHVSNVSGHIMPIEKIIKICKNKKIISIIDGAQSAGVLEYDHKKINPDIYCFTGHKHLLGPMGIGGFVISKKLGELINPLIFGGTGSISEDSKMPKFLPDKFEAGTLNVLGIAGLKGAIEYLLKKDLQKNYIKEKKMSDFLINELKNITDKIKFYGDLNLPRTSLFSFNINFIDNAKLSFLLEDNFDIITRSGLHCSPLAHNTFFNLTGSIRISIGNYTKENEIEYFLNSFKKIIKKKYFK